MNSVNTRLGDINSFMEKVLSSLQRDKVDVFAYFIDHICYKVEKVERYEVLKKDIADENEQISENIIHGRPISVFKLKQPLMYGRWKIPSLELPAPKPGTFYPEGYEHVESVVPDLDDLSKRYAHLKFQEDLIPHNRTLSLKYSSFSIKFHEQPLEEVVKIE